MVVLISFELFLIFYVVLRFFFDPFFSYFLFDYLCVLLIQICVVKVFWFLFYCYHIAHTMRGEEISRTRIQKIIVLIRFNMKFVKNLTLTQSLGKFVNPIMAWILFLLVKYLIFQRIFFVYLCYANLLLYIPL